MKNKFEERKKIIYELISDKIYVPMKKKEMAILLNIPKEKKNELTEVLDALLAEGKITISSKGKIKKAEKSPELEGIFTANAKGFGFVTVEGYAEDFFIPSRYTMNAYHRDTVKIVLLPKTEGRRQEAKVVQIVSHEITTIVGSYEKSKHFGFVVADNKKIAEDIFIPEEKSLKAESGQKVLCELTFYGNGKRKPEGKIIEIIGFMDEPGTDVLSVVRADAIPEEFPEKVLNQAKTVSKPVSKADCVNREDFRKKMMVTIDGEDSKDLDDAVSLEKVKDGYLLGVHIADVSNYVQEHSALDVEALKRGTSVYLADRVIPMLPKELSNGICSLNENEERLALSCMMTLDATGKMISHKISESVVKIDRRMTYTSVKKILVDKDPMEMLKYHKFVSMFRRMDKVSHLLRTRRAERGAIDFDFPESKLQLDEKGKVKSIEPYEHSRANEIIEDFMLLANETVAREFFERQIPFLYRTHEKPSPEKIHTLMTFVENYGITMHTDPENVKPSEIQEVLEKIKNRPEEAVIATLTLRSMQQARYTVECTGHFGLAAKYYCHFTSPIRRYPDLQIHRIIKETLRGRMNEKRMAHYENLLSSVATETSKLERRADDAEREVEKMKKAEYMQEHIGEEFQGVISGVTEWGFYVALDNTIEGLVPVATLTDDFYRYTEETMELIGEKKNRHFQLGQKVKVRVTAADALTRIIDFALLS